MTKIVTRLFSVFLFAFGPCVALGQEPAKMPPAIRLAKPGERVTTVGTIFFATNRDAVPVGKQTEASATAFLNNPTSVLKYGQAFYKLEGKAHQAGQLDGTVTLSRRERFTDGHMYAPDKSDIVVYVHGFNNDFEDAILQAVLIQQDLALPSSMMVYSWASMGSPIAYHPDRWDIPRNAAPLAEFIVKLAKSRPKGAVHFVVHSMGNDVFLNAIQRLETSGELKNVQLGKVILAAPDVAPDFFAPAVKTLLPHTERVVHYFSTKDRPIFYSRFANPTHGVRAGAKLVEVAGLESIDVDIVNSSKVRGGHGYFAAVHEVLDDIAQVLTDDTSKKNAFDRQKERVEELKSPSGYPYFRFK